MPDKSVHELALDRFKACASAFADQRRREYEDLRFAAGEQWPDDIKAQRAGGQAFGSLPPQPARPCLTIDKLLQPLRQGENQMRQAQLSLEFTPKGEGASEEDAEVFEDIARAIQADSRAHLARTWAYGRMLRTGFGAYRLHYDYDETGEQYEIQYKRILNQSNVYLDPFAQEPDWSDGRYAFIVDWMPLSMYEAEFPDSDLARALDDQPFSDFVANNREWFQAGEDGAESAKAVQIAEYFYITGKGKTRKVMWSKINAVEVLKSERWLGKYIPIVPVVGDEENINGERRWKGIVRPAMDAQRSYNIMRSAQVETVGLATRAPYILDPKAIEGYEPWWWQQNTRNFPYLPAATFDERGQPFQVPHRNVEEPAIQAITLAAHEADGDIKATTGYFDPSLGNLNPSERSGKAVLALQKQQELGASGYIGNLADCSMLLEGKILKDLIPKIYDEPGRIMATIGMDNQSGQVMLNHPFVMKNGQPQAVQTLPFGQLPPNVRHIDLSRGAFSVAVTIGKSFTTRREEGASAMGQLAESAPQLVPSYADLWVGNMDFPGARQISDRLKKSLPPQLQDSPDGQPSPEMLQAQLAQTMQQLQHVTGFAQQLHEQIQTKQVENDAMLAKAKADNDTKLEIAKIQAGAQLAVQDLKSSMDSAKLIAEQLRTLVDAAEEQRLAGHQAGHADHMATQQHAHDATMLALEHVHELRTAQQAHDHAMAQQQQASDAAMAQQAQAAEQAQQQPEAGA
jgi:hypothetical protein